VTPKQFNKAIQGTVSPQSETIAARCACPLRAEDQTSRSSATLAAAKPPSSCKCCGRSSRAHSAILYDPACELSSGSMTRIARHCPQSVDAVPVLGPSEELVRRAGGRRLPRHSSNPPMIRGRVFHRKPAENISPICFSNCPRRSSLVHGCRPGGDRPRVKNTRLASLIDPSAPHQRSGVLAR